MMALLIATLGTGLTPTVNAQPVRDGVKGVIVNGSKGGIIPPSLEVFLLTIDNSTNRIIATESKQVSSDGSFSFDNPIWSPGFTLRVVADAGEYTPSVDLTAMDDWTDVALTIYEQTDSLEYITISSYVMMIPTINARHRRAGVLIVVKVNNMGDRVWIPDTEDPGLTGLDLLRFNLPDGFSNLSVESELPPGNILEIGTGFAMTNPIPPGEWSILMSYVIGYEGDGFNFDLKVPYGTDEVRILLPDEDGLIISDELSSSESVVVAERVYKSVNGTNYAAGSVLAVTFSGLPEPTFLQSVSELFGGRTYVIVIVSTAGIFLIGILGFALYSVRQKPSGGEKSGRAVILAQIAALDEHFESGNIDARKYIQQRKGLIQLALEIAGESSDPGTADPAGEADADKW
jgi:hypothetical protein